MQSSILFLLTTILLSVAVFAQTPGAPSSSATTSPAAPLQSALPNNRAHNTTLTLDQALALAEENSPALKQAAATVDRAYAGIQTAKTYTNPTFDVLSGHQAARPIATPGVPGLLQHYGVEQTVEIPAERRARLRVAQLDLVGNKYQLAGVRPVCHCGCEARLL